MILNCLMDINDGMLAFFGGLGPWEVMAIMAALLLLFGGKKLPELAKGMGKGLRHFKQELHGVKEEIEREPEEEEDTYEPDTEDEYSEDSGEEIGEGEKETNKEEKSG